MFVIDHVSEVNGDWFALYLNDHMKYEGNSDVPRFIWLAVIKELAAHNEILVRQWTTNMTLKGESIYPVSMSDLLLFHDNYDLTPVDDADACILH